MYETVSTLIDLKIVENAVFFLKVLNNIYSWDVFSGIHKFSKVLLLKAILSYSCSMFRKSYIPPAARIRVEVPELVMSACFGLIHLPHTEPMRSETPRQLSHCQLSQPAVNWVNAEWESMSTESMQKEPTFTKIPSFRVDSVDVESDLALTQLMGNETPCQLSHRRRLKISISRQIQEQNPKHSNAFLFGLYVFDQCKNPEQKSHARVPLRELLCHEIFQLWFCIRDHSYSPNS
jgi:hypothetical protein